MEEKGKGGIQQNKYHPIAEILPDNRNKNIKWWKGRRSLKGDVEGKKEKRRKT